MPKDLQVPLQTMLALDQVLGDPWSRSLVKFDLFWDFDSLSKEERKTKQRSRDLDPFLGPFWDLGLCNGGMGCRPMGLPMFRPIL
jgi:hypothetical protein